MADKNNNVQEDQDQEQTNEEKVEIDPSELEDKEDSDSPEKVELDLDDAPFLEEEEEEEEQETGPEKLSLEEEGKKEEKSAQAAAWWKRKWVVFSASGLLLLLIVFLIWFIFFQEPEKVQEKKPASEPTKTKEEPSEPEQINMEFKPFQIEYAQNDQIHFLHCQLAFAVNDVLKWEVKRKTLVLRDAIYYYLRNRDLTFLNNKDNVEKLKKDLSAVVNQFLSNGRIQEILIQEYRIE